MKIAYNPLTEAALTAAPSNNDITFDLKGIAIYAKGVKFKGTDTTYSVFKKHTSDNEGGYNGLVPVPSYTTTTTRYLREDGTWVVPTNTTYSVFTGATSSTDGTLGLVPKPTLGNQGKFLKADGTWATPTNTTYGVVSSSANGLAPKVINTNTTTVGSAYYVLASSNGSATPSWYKLPANAFKNDNTTYTFTSGATGNFTVTPSGGTAQTVSIGKPATAGTADVAVKLQTKRKLWGLDFDGSANVSGDMTGVGNITINATDNKDYFINFLYNSTPAYSWRLGYLGSGLGNANYFVIDSSKSSGGTWHRALQIGNETLDATFTGSVIAPTFTGNLDGTYVNALTDYTKSTTASDIVATDTLNAALGKLEYKADIAYNLVKGAYDGDGTIENLAEILKVLEGISDTDTIQAIVGKYLPLTGGELTGQLKISQGNLLISSGHTVTGWLYPKDDGESSLGQGTRRWKDTYTVLINGGTPLQSNNYNSYAPKLDGTGATGTWNISISGTSANADTVDDLHASDFEAYKCTVIDTTGLNENTWYPVTFEIGCSLQTRVRVEGRTSTTGSWNNRSDKHMAVLLDYVVQGSTWGWITPTRIVYDFELGAGAGGTNCVAGLGLLTNSSTEYVYVRGGAKYNFYISRFITPVLRTTSYTVSSQTIAPTTTSPAAITTNNALKSDLTWSNVSGKPSFATVATSGSYNDLSNKPSIPTVTNYYWADVKISSSSNAATTPTFSTIATTSTSYVATLRPTTTTTYFLGSSKYRWNNVFSYLGNFSGQITSSVAAGTAPFKITSTTVNANLNADMVDGKHASDFAAASHSHSYLPLSGGTMTGPITMNTSNYIYGVYEDSGAILFFDGTRTVIGSVGASSTASTHIRTKDSVLTVGSGNTASYTVLHSGNSNVSGGGSSWGSSITVKINNTTATLTIPSNPNTWRGITDSYSGTDSTISLSQKGGNALYNALVNGYASSAGNADTVDNYHIVVTNSVPSSVTTKQIIFVY